MAKKKAVQKPAAPKRPSTGVVTVVRENGSIIMETRGKVELGKKYKLV